MSTHNICFLWRTDENYPSFITRYPPCLFFCLGDYRNFPKLLDRQVWANSADPDQTAPRGAV